MRIYYYTGTGNSLWTARKLGERLGGAELISMKKSRDPLIPAGCDHLGLVFPVHIFGLIGAVREFVDRLKSENRLYVFAVAVNAGALARTLLQLDKALRRKGLSLQAGFSLILPSNYIPWGGPGSQEQIEQSIRDAENRIGEIAGFVKAGREGSIEKGRLWQNILFTGIYRMTFPIIYRMDRSFWVDGRCTSCGICVEVCSVHNVELSEGRPAWLGHCEQCLACLQWCPQEAIQFGKSTPRYQRYQHPEITLQDIIAGVPQD